MSSESRTRRGLVGASLLAILMATPLTAQYSPDPVMNFLMRQNLGIRPLGDYVAEAAQNAAEFAAQKMRLSAELSTARTRFWQLYPDKPGFPQAKATFGRLLRDKDNYYLLVRIVSPLNDPVFAWVTGGEVDGGIPRFADPAFEAWENATRGLLESQGAQILFTPGLGKAEMAKLEPLYERYAVRRDWEEFRAAGKRPPNLPPNVWRLALLAIDAGLDSPYSAAVTAHERGNQFMAQCADAVPKVLELQTMPRTACSCLEQALQEASPKSRWRLETEFSSDAFLVAAVSRIGVRDKVAACLR